MCRQRVICTFGCFQKQNKNCLSLKNWNDYDNKKAPAPSSMAC